MTESKDRQIILNIAMSLLLQIVSVVCAFIVPRLILHAYGSEVNGLIVSVTQFLSYITLLEGGIGGVLRHVLYRPLAEDDNFGMSAAVNAGKRFFRSVGFCFMGYMAVLAVTYPLFSESPFDFLSTASMVLIIGISTLLQYFFATPYTVLLHAAQRRYVTYSFEILALLLNTLATVVLIRLGASAHVVKLASAAVFALRPLLLTFYIRRHYRIDRAADGGRQLLAKRWHGLSQHVAFFLHSNTGVAVLTLVSRDLKYVSVYSVHALVITALNKLTTIIHADFEATFGNRLALGRHDELKSTYKLYDFIIHFVGGILFTAAALLISSFVGVYVGEVSDTSYHYPLFAALLVAAEGVYCLRLPSQAMVVASGSFKQTELAAWFEVGINVVLSVVLLKITGIAGVALGSLAAMAFRLVTHTVFVQKNLLGFGVGYYVKRYAVTLASAAAGVLLSGLLGGAEIHGFGGWILRAIPVTAIVSAAFFIGNIAAYPSEMKSLFKRISGIIKKNRKTGRAE